jgi:hypothetical protein
VRAGREKRCAACFGENDDVERQISVELGLLARSKDVSRHLASAHSVAQAAAVDAAHGMTDRFIINAVLGLVNLVRGIADAGVANNVPFQRARQVRSRKWDQGLTAVFRALLLIFESAVPRIAIAIH